MENDQYNNEVQSNSSIRELAYSQLKGNWTVPVITALAYMILSQIISVIPIPGTEMDISGFVGNYFGSEMPDEVVDELMDQAKVQFPILTLLLTGAMTIGLCAFHLTFAKKGEAELPQIFDGFKQIIQAIIASFLMMIIVSVGYLLFIVPGVILSLGLSQTYFIMADNPGIKATDAMQQSWEMMKGHKGQLFMLGLSFIPWAILCVFTLFIGYFWLMPYMYVSFSHFYLQLKGEDLEVGLEDHLIVGE
jgi:uncharacterized membrane protein